MWFKLWCSAADDPDLDNLDVADFGRWCKFGAFMKRHGTTGEIELRPPARGLCASLQLADFDALAACFTRFPHVTMRRDNSPVSSETTLTVSFTNWPKYQGDFSTPRVKRFRAMKRPRGEEKRREERRREEKRTPPLSPPQPISSFQLRGPLLEALEKAPVLGRLRGTAWWQAEVRANPGVDFAREVLKAEAWMQANPAKAPKRDFRRFLHTWLARAYREIEDDD